jgi:hypothetical protein
VIRDFRNVSFAVGWRVIHNVLHNPTLLFPGLIFPLINFAAFAGGLSRLRHIEGFDYGSLRYRQLSERGWNAYATDTFFTQH